MLLLRRNKDQHCGGLWSFPGGKVDVDEQPETAAKRELKEETALIGTDWLQLCQQDFTYPDRLLHFTLFCCLCDNVSMLETETSHIWSAPSTLHDYPMPEANEPFITILISKFEDGLRVSQTF